VGRTAGIASIYLHLREWEIILSEFGFNIYYENIKKKVINMKKINFK